MASPSKSVRLTGFSPKSLVLTVLVLILIIGLFFIPEIIDLQKSLMGGQTEPAGQKEQTEPDQVLPSEEEAPADEQPQQGQGPAVPGINELMTSNYLEGVKARRILDQQLPRRASEKDSGLTWDAIRSRSSAPAIRNAQKVSLEVARQLGSEKVASRFAMYNFASGLGLMLEGGEKSMTALEGVRYLEYLQAVALRTMEREGVDRALYNRWVSLSLGPIISQNSKLKEAMAMLPFAPNLTLVRTDIRAEGEHRRRWIEDSPVFLRMEGFVVGGDVRDISIVVNGNELQHITPRRPNLHGVRTFKTKRMNARGIFQFRVRDKSGQVWEKLYVFYPRVRRFPWAGGVFQIPLTGERLDRYFTFRPGRLLTVPGGEPVDPMEEGGIGRF